jgi:hypothetical protein
MWGMVMCPNCGRDTVDGNFCRRCGKKMREVCDCWVLKKQHNCGYDECPGLLVLRQVHNKDASRPTEKHFDGFASDTG